MLSDTDKKFRNVEDSRRVVYLLLIVTEWRRKTPGVCVEEQSLNLEREGTNSPKHGD